MGRLNHPVDFMINMMPGPLKPFNRLEKLATWGLYSTWTSLCLLALYQGLTSWSI